MREETSGETTARLLEVIARADFEVLPGAYVFRPLDDGTTSFRRDALAAVRDNGAWSLLVPVEDPATPMAFRMFSFHFDPALDATGFVGWLHSHLARTTDTDHIVVCGRSVHGSADRDRGRPIAPEASSGRAGVEGVQRPPEQRCARRADGLPRPRPPRAEAHGSRRSHRAGWSHASGPNGAGKRDPAPPRRPTRCGGIASRRVMRRCLSRP